ncbi:hypothetical protein HII31_03442 [Pseudocercospora fuligena]|uniref:BTB domain-containing protein n=1 Tax=Pseudocercospora fuligena TaxID=685502 RepID=A0A8H6RQE1_9PEZI|nr:hypothetical protein HII31_03442 [Pseudocercospora fuligena]
MATGKTKAALPHVMRPSSAAINFIARPALVKVGTPHTTFHINEELLCSGSEFFKAALKKDWHEEPEELYPWKEHVEAYALGDLLMDVDFKDAIMDALMVGMFTKSRQQGSYCIPGPGHRKALYEVTLPGCKARKMLAHRIADGAATVIKDSEDPAMLYDIMQILADKSQSNLIVATARCDFHEHEKGEENCYRKKFAKPFMFDDFW